MCRKLECKCFLHHADNSLALGWFRPWSFPSNICSAALAYCAARRAVNGVLSVTTGGGVPMVADVVGLSLNCELITACDVEPVASSGSTGWVLVSGCAEFAGGG
jgi:hypothetical protein